MIRICINCKVPAKATPKVTKITKTIHVPDRQPQGSLTIGFGGVTLENCISVVGPEIPYTGDVTSQGLSKHVHYSTQTGTQPMQRLLAEVAIAYIVFACPHCFNRDTELARDQRRFEHVVPQHTTPEAATDVG